jgi:prepilin-type N-terminal cleavage/methylation domain-containing protein
MHQQHETATSRRGFTLVEMLVATAVTLLLIAGLAQVFQFMGDTVAIHRSSIELAGRVRAVSLRLQRDLEGLTVPVRPIAQGQGYFEYIEGSQHDGSHFPTNVRLDRSVFGDGDDMLMFTSRSADTPFLGVYLNSSGTRVSISSRLSEIVWWATLTDINDDGIIDGVDRDDYTIYRRSFLIRPDLNTLDNATIGRYYQILRNPNGSSTVFDTTTAAGRLELADALKTFYEENDLSIRFERTPAAGGSSTTFFVVCNSLEELTNRRNRFAHDRIVVGGNYFRPTFPYNIGRGSNNALDFPYSRLPNALTERGVIKSGVRRGEDVILSHAAAFDVRAFDPVAVLGANPSSDGTWGITGNAMEAGWAGSDDEIVGPGSFEYAPLTSGAYSVTSFITTPTTTTATTKAIQPAGRGAYVDLYYTSKIHIIPNTDSTYRYDSLEANSNLKSYFSGVPSNVSGTIPLAFATYDTWPQLYEFDGIDQDGDGSTDEGTDGLDTDSANGVDDPGERETSPPYSVPLRGIQVRIRVVDHDSRQVRQATVVSNFTPE